MDIYPSCDELASELAPLYQGNVENRGLLTIDLLERSMALDTVCPMSRVLSRHEPELSEPEFIFSCTVYGQALVDLLQSRTMEALLQRAYVGTTECTVDDDYQVHLTDDAKQALDEISELIISEIDLNDHALVSIAELSDFFDMDNDYHDWWGDDETLDDAVAGVELMFENEIDRHSGRLIIEEVNLREAFLEAALERFYNDPTSRHLYRSHVEALVEAGDIDQEDADEWKRDCGERD